MGHILNSILFFLLFVSFSIANSKLLHICWLSTLFRGGVCACSFKSAKSNITLDLKYAKLGKLASMFSLLHVSKGCQRFLPTPPANSKEVVLCIGICLVEAAALSHGSCSLVILGVFLLHYHLTICLQKLMPCDYGGAFLKCTALFCTGGCVCESVVCAPALHPPPAWFRYTASVLLVSLGSSSWVSFAQESLY